MKLSNAIQGATLRPQRITWWLGEDRTLTEDLTGLTITGEIKDEAGTKRPITGTLVIVPGMPFQFDWTYSDADVADPGTYRVQFSAESAGHKTKTYEADWEVIAGI